MGKIDAELGKITRPLYVLKLSSFCLQTTESKIRYALFDLQNPKLKSHSLAECGQLTGNVTWKVQGDVSLV